MTGGTATQEPCFHGVAEDLREGGLAFAGSLPDITCYGAMAGSMCVEWCRYVQEV